MKNQIYWALGVLVLLIIIVGVWHWVGKPSVETAEDTVDTSAEKRLAKDQADFEKQQQEVSEHSQEHDHADGTFHGSEHDNPLHTAPSEWTPALVKIPEGITAPDVKAAWERLNYISKNRHQWGNFSPRALELMAELTPLPEFGSSEYGDCGEEIMFALEELAELRDPRSAELLVSYQMDSGILGRPPNEALLAMGPAAVPALITRLYNAHKEDSLSTPLKLLPRIVASHRSELGGIVQHIIIPKIEEIADYESNHSFAIANKSYALIGLEAILQKPKN